MNTQNGFTIVELVSTMVIITILASLALVGFSALKEGMRINSATKELHSLFHLAKLNAIRRRAPVAIAFTAGTGSSGRYVVFVDNGSSIKLLEASEDVIARGTMPDGVIMSDVSFASSAARFNTVGIPVASTGSVGINNGSNKYRRITLGAGGATQIELSSNNTNWRQ
ncbi:MAG: GspH/FimT family pseudopilin [Desulfobacterales bacterium]|nr:GspH/FimT family pseudopilin [Desulfobacterales bacterium]